MRYYVKDFREGSICRIEGPFSYDEAHDYVQRLNDFIHKHSDLGWLGGKVTGPFYAVPEKALSAAELREIKRLASC